MRGDEMRGEREWEKEWRARGEERRRVEWRRALPSWVDGWIEWVNRYDGVVAVADEWMEWIELVKWNEWNTAKIPQ
jgi:hypothetical protein